MSWKGILAATALLSVIAAVFLVVQARGSGQTTATVAGPAIDARGSAAVIPSAVPVQGPAARSAVDAAVATVVPPDPSSKAPTIDASPTPGPAVSPEKAMEIVQKSGLDSSQTWSVNLVTDANGRSIYELRSGDNNGTVIQVDAQTGVLLTPVQANP